MKLTGLIAAPFTPFREDGSLNKDLIWPMAESLIADGVKGAYICGSTGEGISCTVEERITIMETWKKAAQGKLTLIAHVGALALGDVEKLAKAAAALGFDAFSVVPANYFKPANEKSLAKYCARVAAFAPELPFYYYHTMNSGINLSMRKFLEVAEVPNLAGVKFNHHDLYEYQNCLAVKDGKYDIVYGVDEFYAGALASGAKGFIGSTYNYSAEIYQAINRAFAAGDWETVRQGMRKVCQGVDLLVNNGGLPAGKAMMLLKGIDCGPARLPLRQLNRKERQDIADAMAAIIQGRQADC